MSIQAVWVQTEVGRWAHFLLRQVYGERSGQFDRDDPGGR